MKADMRCDPFTVLKSELVREILYNQFLKLSFISEILRAEKIIESDTKDIIDQIALDFKVALQAVDEITTEKEREKNINRKVKTETSYFSTSELNRMREWFNAIKDLNPKFIEEQDRDLLKKIVSFKIYD